MTIKPPNFIIILLLACAHLALANIYWPHNLMAISNKVRGGRSGLGMIGNITILGNFLKNYIVVRPLVKE
jgi:hypothetical protein